MIELDPGDRVLVRLPSWLGDLVAAEPLVAALDAAVRAGRVAHGSLAAPGRLLALFDGRFPSLARLSVAPRTLPSLGAWRGHTLAVLLDGSTRSTLGAWRAGIGERLGLARFPRGLLLTQPVRPARERGGTPFGVGRRGRFPRELPRPFAAVCRELGALAGLEVLDRPPRLVPTEDGRRAAAARLAALGIATGEPYLVVNAGGRPGSAKALPDRSLAALLAELDARAVAPVLVVAGPGELGRLARVMPPGARRVHALAEPPVELAELVALVAGSRGFVGPDAGPAHLAAALGVASVRAFGPTDPRHSAEGRVRTVRHIARAPCAPCHRERCPLRGERHLACWRGLDPVGLARDALALLASGSAVPSGRGGAGGARSGRVGADGDSGAAGGAVSSPR